MKRLTADEVGAGSADVLARNIENLRTLFPDAFTEGKIDFDVLKQLLGGAIDERDEKYGLDWYGKRRARQLALTPSMGTLRPCQEDSVDWDTTRNLLIEGDNLEVLKLLQKSYVGKVKLIYVDPPYNTGKDFVYRDNFHDNIKNYLELTGQVDGAGRRISSHTEANGRFHTDWLNMMYPRLKLAKDLLHSCGAIFVSLDDTEIANFRAMADEIFGAENFLTTIAWEKVHTRKNSAKTFSVSHDYIVAYAKDLPRWDRSLLPRETTSSYRNPDGDPKGPWKSDPITAHNAYSADYPITKPNGVVLARPSGRYWAYSEETWNAKVAANEVVWGNGDAYPTIKRYLADVQDGLVPTTLFSRTFAGDTATAKEIDRLFGAPGVFDYPKPTLLVQRLIQICARPGDVVMDFFAGSGTTGHALWRQNAIDNGGRRFVLVQLPERLDADTVEQKAAVGICRQLGKPSTIAELTKERLRRAAAAVKQAHPSFAGDLGFRVFKLDSSNIRAWDPDTKDLAQSLLDALEHLKADRTESDIFCELLLKFGLDLSAPMERCTIAGKDVRAAGGGVLLACLATRIVREDVELLAQGIIEWHDVLGRACDTTCIFRDSAFADDATKIDLTAILERRGIARVRSC